VPIAYTSRAALAAIVADLVGRQREVYDVIRNWDDVAAPGPSIEDVAAELGCKESSVCGRVNELIAAGAIQCGPFKLNRTGHAAKTYRALVFREYSPAPAARQLDFFAGAKQNGLSPYQTRV
jgi:hypothetical protein